ncbi:uncharacterized protein LOC121418224 [Lytechinus variegatus]|uniref:uncharacterized protein LOC121418224 n=1 Tax=Lytechinus variegatus TaxID=7654 RepID=UPI001BB0E546|nr:uncharacterized protein LOC121418224 [Lytechinus variegatus]
MARFSEVVCRASVILLGVISFGATLPILEKHIGEHGSADAFYQKAQAAGKAMRDHLPSIKHVVQHKPNHLNLTASTSLQPDEISKKLNDLQAKFEELSEQNEAMRRMLDDKVSLNQNIDALVGKLNKIYGESPVSESLGKLANDAHAEVGFDDEKEQAILSQYISNHRNREAELVRKIRNQTLSSSISFLKNRLRQDSSSNETQSAVDIIARILVQLRDPEDTKSHVHLSETEISPGAPNREEFQNGSANVVKELELHPALASRTEPALNTNDSDRATAASRKIAFSVAATEPQLGVAGVAQAVQFQDILENKGEGFLASNHTFICSVPGWYYFTYSLRTFQGKYLSVLLMKNADYVVGVYTDKDDVRNTMETQSTVIYLLAGDAVWLRLPPSQDFALFSDKYRYSTFTGFLLFKE